MARPIAETPILYGEDATRFMQRMHNVQKISAEEKERRFAISRNFAGLHLGTSIIDGIKLKLFENAEYSACRFLTVDAYRGALGFYEKNGFMPLLKEPDKSQPTVPLYYDLKAVL